MHYSLHSCPAHALCLCADPECAPRPPVLAGQAPLLTAPASSAAGLTAQGHRRRDRDVGGLGGGGGRSSKGATAPSTSASVAATTGSTASLAAGGRRARRKARRLARRQRARQRAYEHWAWRRRALSGVALALRARVWPAACCCWAAGWQAGCSALLGCAGDACERALMRFAAVRARTSSLAAAAKLPLLLLLRAQFACTR